MLPPRMHVDRVFSMKGFGTVVTGTLIEGKVKLGDEVTIYPSEIPSKIRSIQVHGAQVEEAVAGQRTALNLAGVKLSQIERGDILATPKAMENTWMLDVKVKVLSDSPYSIRLWDRLRLHLGTKEILCRVVPLGTDEIKPGEERFLQLRLEEKAVASQGDKCVLRTYSPQVVIGGAVILESNPKKHKRFNQDLLEDLAIKEKGKPEDLIENYLIKNPKILVMASEIISYIGIETKQIERLLEELVGSGQLIQLKAFYIHGRRLEEIKGSAIHHLQSYHASYPLRQGIGKEELRSKMGLDMKGKEFDLLLNQFVEEQVIKWEELISLEEFKVVYDEEQLAERANLEQQLIEAKFSLLSIGELTSGKEERKELIDSLHGKTLIRLDGDSIIHKECYQKAIDSIRQHVEENEKITLGEFRDMLGTSRKHAMTILDYMDKSKVTKRVGEARVLFPKV